jgi:exonuclease SbcC
LSAVIEELKLENFGGYKQAELRFFSGLNLIRGRNSTGKTSILDALVFTFFGEAFEIRPRLLISKLPDSKEMTTYVKFRSPRTGDTVEITRKGKLDNKGSYRTTERLLLINGKEIDVEGDEDLRSRTTELMGVGLRKFLNLVYVRQGKLTAILEPPREQMDAIIGITLLRELREQLDEVRKSLERYEGRDVSTEVQNLKERIIPQLASSLALQEGDIKSLELEARELQDLVRKGASPELAALLGQIREKENADERIRELEAKNQELLGSAKASSPDQLESKIRNCREELNESQAMKGSLVREAEESLEVWSVAKGKADSLESEIREHEALLKQKVSRCPKCGQDLNREVLRKILRESASQLQDLRADEKKTRKSFDEKKSELEKLNKRIVTQENRIQNLAAIVETLQKYSDSIDELRTTKFSLRSKIQDALDRLDLLLQEDDSELKVKVAQQLPIQPEELVARRKELDVKLKALDEKKRLIRKVADELTTSQALLVQLERRINSAELARRLSEAFDRGVEVRRREFLKRIEFKALDYYKTMTDQHVYTMIIVDPKEYTVWVQPKGLTEPVPASRVGGGHQTLLSLAIRLALLDALSFRSLLILDEPTYGVDSENLPQLAGQIGEASRHLSQTILVTHFDICEEEASNMIDVAMREDGVSSAEVKL